MRSSKEGRRILEAFSVRSLARSLGRSHALSRVAGGRADGQAADLAGAEKSPSQGLPPIELPPKNARIELEALQRAQSINNIYTYGWK